MTENSTAIYGINNSTKI